MTALLTVNDLHVSYGKVEAVTGVSLEMQAGQIVTVIGPNGAGKTTLLAALMGLLPSKGVSRYEQLRYRRAQHRGARAARHLPRAGAARAVHRDDGQGQPYPRRLYALERPRRRTSATCRMSTRAFRALPNEAISSPARCPAASARCWRSAAR